MRRKHDWIERHDDGRKREMRVTRMGPVWRFQGKFADEEVWTYYDQPSMEDLLAFREILERKYRRNRASYDDVKIVERMIAEAKGRGE